MVIQEQNISTEGIPGLLKKKKKKKIGKEARKQSDVGIVEDRARRVAGAQIPQGTAGHEEDRRLYTESDGSHQWVVSRGWTWFDMFEKEHCGCCADAGAEAGRPVKILLHWSRGEMMEVQTVMVTGDKIRSGGFLDVFERQS